MEKILNKDGLEYLWENIETSFSKKDEVEKKVVLSEEPPENQNVGDIWFKII